MVLALFPLIAVAQVKGGAYYNREASSSDQFQRWKENKARPVDVQKWFPEVKPHGLPDEQPVQLVLSGDAQNHIGVVRIPSGKRMCWKYFPDGKYEVGVCAN